MNTLSTADIRCIESLDESESVSGRSRCATECVKTRDGTSAMMRLALFGGNRRGGVSTVSVASLGIVMCQGY